MCEICKNREHQPEVKFDKKYRLADFFDSWWDIYVQSPKEFIQEEQYKAVNAIRTCRTAALGVDIYACPTCGEISEVYHSCKNRFCPTCSWKDTVKWADRIKKQMLNLPHRHVVFTLPHALNPLIKKNGSRLYNELMRVTADVLKDWIGAKYNLKIGVISVLHTFGEVKNFHPHIHMIVSWGGIDMSTGQLTVIKSDYLKYDFLQTKFRCKFEDELIRHFDNGDLEHGFKDRIAFMKFIKQINKKQWVVHLEAPMEIPSTVIRYIGRYSKRACLSEYKITLIEGENIRFRYKDYKTLDFYGKPIEKELELHYTDFFPRLLQHVPLAYFRIVRYYGLYATKVHIPKMYLYYDTSRESEEANDYEDPQYCQHCKVEKIYQFTEINKRKKEWFYKSKSIEPNWNFVYKRNIA